MRRLLVIPALLAALAVAACGGSNAVTPGAATGAASPTASLSAERAVASAGQPSIDCTALPSATFTVYRDNGRRAAGPVPTSAVWNAGGLSDDNYYLVFDNDAAGKYQAIEPERPGSGFVHLRRGKFDFTGRCGRGMDEYFSISPDGRTLSLQAGAYTVVQHDLTSISGLPYNLQVEGDGGGLCGRGGRDGDDGNTSQVGYAAFGDGSRYRITYGARRGGELVFPDEPASGRFEVRNGAVGAKGNYGDAYTVTGSSVKLNDAAYIRVRNDNNWGGSPRTWRLTLQNGIPFSILNSYDTTAPWDSFVLGSGLKFKVAAGWKSSQLLTVGPGKTIDGFGAKGYSFDGVERSGVLMVDGGPYPDRARLLDAIVLANINGVDVINGGYGSSIAPVPGEPYSFYLLTDRGPNIDGANANEKVFPVPGFNPQIGKFYLYDDSLAKDSVILLRDSSGHPRTGLPRPPGSGGNTGEIGKDYDGNTLYDPQGIDSEGLVALPGGTFWVSDEYGPFVLHLAADGTTIEELNPFNGTLPKVLALRKPNKGMEGLTITPNGTLVGIMQDPLSNPTDNSTTKNSRVSRIVTYKAGVTHQYVYVFETKDMGSSELTALSDTTFLVDERDGNFPGDPGGSIKRVYKIDISGATDVSDPADGANGLLWAGKTLEQVTYSGLAANGIVPVTKTLVEDVAGIPGYTHDKFEGLSALDSDTLAISNDDDFSVTGSSVLETKYLLDGSTIDFGEVFFVHPATPFE